MGASWADGKNEASPAEAGEYRGLSDRGGKEPTGQRQSVSSPPEVQKNRRIEERGYENSWVEDGATRSKGRNYKPLGPGQGRMGWEWGFSLPYICQLPVAGPRSWMSINR